MKSFLSKFSIAGELLEFFWQQKLWWMVPMIVVLLLLGAIVGKGTGYSGRAAIVEGETWTDARLNYDARTFHAGR